MQDILVTIIKEIKYWQTSAVGARCGSVARLHAVAGQGASDTGKSGVHWRTCVLACRCTLQHTEDSSRSEWYRGKHRLKSRKDPLVFKNKLLLFFIREHGKKL